MKTLRIGFDHGLGDCVHFAHVLQLYRDRGYRIELAGVPNKQFVWRVAGCDLADFATSTPEQRHGWGYPASFEDVFAPDCQANKVAHGIGAGPLPPLDADRETLWQELCAVRLSAIDLIPQEARDEADAFLHDLPRPIVCLHSNGTNWAERKSLPATVTLDLQKQFVKRSPGTLIILDWDSRVPMISHARIKGILPAWGMIDPPRTCALFERSDLLIGVDSGPFHLASFTNVPALGVFREVQHCRCCLPNPRAVYLVPGRHHVAWQEQGRPETWRMTEYSGDEPTADDIFLAADAMLAGAAPESISPDDRMVQSAGIYLYNRVGHDRRFLELLPDGKVGDGGAGRERTWSIRQNRLTIFGPPTEPTCHLTFDNDGVWRGRWLDFEQMPIELTPKLTANIGVVPVPITIPLPPQISSLPGAAIGTRGDGLFWFLDPDMPRSDLGLSDHEDWIFKHFPVGPEVVAVDVGGFIGLYAIWLAKRCAAVYACEPDPKNRRLLEINSHLNGVHNLQIIPRAITDRQGVARWTHNAYTSRLVPAGESEVECTTLDREFAALERCDLLKIDVEGEEPAVLRGGLQFIQRLRPRILIEVHSHMDGCSNNGNLVVDLLEPLNYDVYRIWENTPAYYYIAATPK